MKASVARDVRTTLPRGRHALPRAEVMASQRGRLLRAMIDEVAERGFAATTAAAVYRRAGVSSRAFYENFSDVRDCFLAAYDESVRITLASVRPAVLGPDTPARRDPLTRFAELLERYLRLLAREPNVARTFLIEIYGAGAEPLRRRVQVHQQFVTGVQEVLGRGHRLGAVDRFAIESLVDAITFRVTRHLIAEDPGDLTALVDDLLELAVRLCPWLDRDD